MINFIKKQLIKLLFRLLDNDYHFEDINDEAIEMWLAKQYGQPGFLEYFRKRDLQILKTFATLPEKQDYWNLVGKRMELIKLHREMERAHKNRKKMKKDFEKNKKDKKS